MSVEMAEKKLCICNGEESIPCREYMLSIIRKHFNGMTPFYEAEFLFIFPFTNQAIALLSGIEAAYCSRNFLCAAILTRSLLDCVMSLIYVDQARQKEDYKEFIEEYERTGELTKPNSKRTKRYRLHGNDLVEAFKNFNGINVNNTYVQLSKMVHPTKFHFHASTTPTPDSDCDCGIAFYGEKTEYPQHLYDELLEIIELCIDQLELIWASL